MISVDSVAMTLAGVSLPTRTVHRVRCLLLRSHIEELVERIPTHLVPQAARNRVLVRMWSLVGEASLSPQLRTERQSVVRGLVATYGQLSDVLHGRRIELCPDPVDLKAWGHSVRAGCRLLPPSSGTCGFCTEPAG